MRLTLIGHAILGLFATCSLVWCDDDPRGIKIAADEKVGVFAASFRALADDLARGLPQSAISIAVGNFLYEDTELMSPFSSRLRQELESALSDTGKFKIVTRDRLGDAHADMMLQGASHLDRGVESAANVPAKPASTLPVSTIQGIVRGRFYYKPPAVTVCAELASLADGTVHKARVILSAQAIATHVIPPALSSPSSDVQAMERLDTLLRPQSFAQSQANVADIQRRITAIPHDFEIQLTVKQARTDFAEGEMINYRLWSDTDCHVAVFCHQVNGSTIVLFPNACNRDTRLTANARVDIPGSDKSGFQIVIGPPFGGDVVQVIACTQASALHRMVSELTAKPALSASAYRGVDRGMVVQGLTDSLTESQPGPAGPARWSEAHIVVSTYQKWR